MWMTARCPRPPPPYRRVHPYSWSLIIVATVTGLLWLVQHSISAANIALFYLVVVLLCAATAGRAPAVIAAVASFLTFKFFFVEPVLTYTIDNITDPWQLFSFVAAALIAGAITLHAREQAAMARATGARDDNSLSAQPVDQHRARLEADRAGDRRDHPGRSSHAQPANCSSEASMASSKSSLRRVSGRTRGSVTATLRAGEQTLGDLRIALAPQQTSLDRNQQQLLETLANQAALALERSRLAQAAARAEALAESDRLKSTLISTVSHDLRTPLAAITAAADELMAEDVQWSAAAILDFAQIIKGEATQLYHLVSNMLDLTRIEAGVLRPQRGWYNVAEIVYHVLQRLARIGRPSDGASRAG